MSGQEIRGGLGLLPAAKSRSNRSKDRNVEVATQDAESTNGDQASTTNVRSASLNSRYGGLVHKNLQNVFQGSNQPNVRHLMAEATRLAQNGQAPPNMSPETEAKWTKATQMLSGLNQQLSASEQASLSSFTAGSSMVHVSQQIDPRDASHSHASIASASEEASGNAADERHPLWRPGSTPSQSVSQPETSQADVSQWHSMSGSTGPPDPRTYYEYVPPSDWKPDKPDTCLELHRKAYCGHGDAIFPFLYFGIIAAICHWRLLPFWGTCLLLLPMFVAGMTLIVFKGAGHTPKTIPRSKVLFSFVMCVEVFSLGLLVWGLMPALPDYLPEGILLVLICLTGIYVHVWSMLVDPGFIPVKAAGGSEMASDTDLESQSPSLTSMGSCDTCHVERPLRSKHCGHCQRCVVEFDHHCPVIGNCIGINNRRKFLVFIVLILLDQILFMHLAWVFLSRQHIVPSTGEDVGFWEITRRRLAKFAWSVDMYPGLIFLMILEVPLTIANAMLVFRQLLAVISNLTTNELYGRKKYLYLRDEHNNFHNSFDRGCAANCQQFWCVRSPDWAAIFEEDRQARGGLVPAQAPSRVIGVLDAWREKRKGRRRLR